MTSPPSILDGMSTPHARSLHLLTITPFYPSQGDDAVGCFVAEPLPWLQKLGTINTVIAAQPFYRGKFQVSANAPPAYWSRYFSVPGGFGLPASGGFLFSSILSRVRKLHFERPIDLIHAHAPLPCGHAAVLLGQELKIPLVVTVHGLDAFSTNQVQGMAGEWCKRSCQWVYRSARKVICISEKVRQQVFHGAAADAVVVYNGVDLAMFAPSSTLQTAPVILSVGNLIPIKGHELLLRAFAAVHQRYPDVSWEIIGEGPEKVRLARLAQELGVAGKVRFQGRKSRSQVAEAMARCLLFALPSRYEGLGCVYLEAMSSAKPVIACRSQGIEEIIEHGRNGWLIDPEDLPAMTGALSQLLQDKQLRLELGADARHTIERRHTLAHQSAALLRLYQEALA